MSFATHTLCVYVYFFFARLVPEQIKRTQNCLKIKLNLARLNQIKGRI